MCGRQPLAAIRAGRGEPHSRTRPPVGRSSCRCTILTGLGKHDPRLGSRSDSVCPAPSSEHLTLEYVRDTPVNRALTFGHQKREAKRGPS